MMLLFGSIWLGLRPPRRLLRLCLGTHISVVTASRQVNVVDFRRIDFATSITGKYGQHVGCDPTGASAGRLSRMLFVCGIQTASDQPSGPSRVKYSHHTVPTRTRQLPPGFPRNASHTLPCPSQASRG